MAAKSRSCNGCSAETWKWRQCPDNNCRLDLCYCDSCGGDERATAEMSKHIILNHTT